MRTINQVIINGVPLSTIIENHQHWLNADCIGWEDMKADLNKTDLSYVDFGGMNLRNINFSGANLNFAKFYDADLRFANFEKADLSHAGLQRANLYKANLRMTHLHNTDFLKANLYGANFWSAVMTDFTILAGTNINNATFENCNLVKNTKNANGKLATYRLGKILTEDIIGYKKCRDDIIVTLKIPRGAIVFSINGTKCRTNKAKVIAIDGAKKAVSMHQYMSYYVGDEFTIYNFDCRYNTECGEGIHFFMTREEAEQYGQN